MPITGTFTVNVAAASAPLTAAVFAPDITAIGGVSQSITVVYTDTAANIKAATIAGSNLVVTSPQGVVLPITLTGVAEAENRLPLSTPPTPPAALSTTPTWGPIP